MKLIILTLLISSAFIGKAHAKSPQIWTVYGNETGNGPFGGEIPNSTEELEDDSDEDIAVLRQLEEIVSSNSDLISDDDLKTVDDVFDITNDILDVGAAIKPLEKIFGPLSALGKLILRCFHVGRRDDPVMDKLKDIEHQIDMLGKQMTQQFNEMEAYITEHSFEEDIAQSASTLHQFMQDTIAFPGNESISRFYIEYQRNPPIELGYKLMSLLKKDITNPLKAAMNADPLKTKSTFNKWSKTLLDVMFQFLCIETYANGMFDNSTLYGPHRLEDRLRELNSSILDWRAEYTRSNWPTVVTELMNDVQNVNPRAKNDQKAQMIRNGLTQMLQDDDAIYFVVVYDQMNGYKKKGFNSYEVAEGCGLKNCYAAVMRTRKSRNPNDRVYDALQERTVLKRHKKRKDNNRCLKMLDDARVYNPTATANGFIVGGHPAIYTVGSVEPGRIANGWGVWWISTY